MPDQEATLPLHELHDRLVHLVAADRDRAADDDPAERDNRHLGGAAADVDHQVGGCIGDGEVCPDGGRHRLLDQRCLAGAGGEGSFLDGATLDVGDAAGDAENDTRMTEAAPDRVAHEVSEHLLGDVEIGDDAVTEWAGGADRRRCAADHGSRLLADGEDLIRQLVDGDDRRLEEDDPFTAHEDDRVRRAQVNGDLAAPVGEELPQAPGHHLQCAQNRHAARAHS